MNIIAPEIVALAAIPTLPTPPKKRNRQRMGTNIAKKSKSVNTYQYKNFIQKYFNGYIFTKTPVFKHQKIS
jgi:hypothetical protein